VLTKVLTWGSLQLFDTKKAASTDVHGRLSWSRQSRQDGLGSRLAMAL
jgi:hypothetical protein